MIGLGVGIDYALFLVTRHQDQLAAGMAMRGRRSRRAVATSGSAIVFAGGTVVIALLSLGVAGIPLVTALGYASAVAVVTAVLAAITLLPAFLGLVGHRIDSARAAGVPAPQAEAAAAGLWGRWAGVVTRHPLVAVAWSSLALLAPLIIPVFSLSSARRTSARRPTDTTERQAYDLITAGFGRRLQRPAAGRVQPRPAGHARATSTEEVQQGESLQSRARAGAEGAAPSQKQLEAQQAQLEASRRSCEAQQAPARGQEQAQLRAQQAVLQPPGSTSSRPAGRPAAPAGAAAGQQAQLAGPEAPAPAARRAAPAAGCRPRGGDPGRRAGPRPRQRPRSAGQVRIRCAPAVARSCGAAPQSTACQDARRATRRAQATWRDPAGGGQADAARSRCSGRSPRLRRARRATAPSARPAALQPAGRPAGQAGRPAAPAGPSASRPGRRAAAPGNALERQGAALQRQADRPPAPGRRAAAAGRRPAGAGRPLKAQQQQAQQEQKQAEKLKQQLTDELTKAGGDAARHRPAPGEAPGRAVGHRRRRPR